MNQDEELYLQATQEVEDEVIDAALWAKSMALAEGDTKIAKYKYIKLRVEQFKQSSGVEEEKWKREGSIESERIWQKERIEHERIQQEKKIERERIRQEEKAEIERIRQKRRIENERIQKEESEIIAGLSELGCKMERRSFGGWKIREPLGGVIIVKTLEEAKEYYQKKKPAKIEKCVSNNSSAG